MTVRAGAQWRRLGMVRRSWPSMPALGALLLSLPAAAAEPAQYHRTYHFDAGRTLQADPPSPAPAPDEVSRQVSELQAKQFVLNGRLAALDYGRDFGSSAPDVAGVFPLTVTRFSCSCAHGDEDKTCEGLTSRLGNLAVIRDVPFMRKGNSVMAIRSQGLMEGSSGKADTVDALFNGGIYWTGRITGAAYAYNLLLFKSQKDQCVGNLEERIDLSRPVSGIDASLYQCEVAYHLQNESNGPDGKPTLPRDVSAYCSPAELKQVADCYASSAEFNTHAARGAPDLPALAETARPVRGCPRQAGLPEV
jgi:hypothetical protein